MKVKEEMSRVIPLALLATMFLMPLATFAQAEKPNIVLIYMDNFGYGELGVYGGGITRGGATPRIDALRGLPRVRGAMCFSSNRLPI